MPQKEGLLYILLTPLSITFFSIIGLNKKNKTKIYTLEIIPMGFPKSLTCWSMIPENDGYIHYEKYSVIFLGRTVSGISS